MRRLGETWQRCRSSSDGRGLRLINLGRGGIRFSQKKGPGKEIEYSRVALGD